MPVDIEIVREFLKQGAGFLLALIIWYYSRRDYNEIIKKLQGIIQDRKGDRDTQLMLSARIEAHLDRHDRLAGVEQHLIKEVLNPGPKRRALDKKVMEALTREQE